MHRALANFIAELQRDIVTLTTFDPLTLHLTQPDKYWPMYHLFINNVLSNIS